MSKNTVPQESLNTEDVIEMIASRANFAKTDVRAFIDELRGVFEECIEKGFDIDIRGLIHMRIIEMNYKKAPGIIAHRGLKKFNNKTMRIQYSVPLNFRRIIRQRALDNQE